MKINSRAHYLFTVLLALVVIFTFTTAAKVLYDNQRGIKALYVQTIKSLNEAQNVGISDGVSMTGNFDYDSGTFDFNSGTTPTFNAGPVFARDRVKLLKFTDLESLSGSATKAGQSVYYVKPAEGNIIKVDPHILANRPGEHVCTPGGTTAFGQGTAFSGITIFAPNADTYPDFSFTVEYVDAGDLAIATAGNSSGVSQVWVAPFPGSGATSYGEYGTSTAAALQSRLVDYGSSGTSIYSVPVAVTKGSIDKSLDLPGEQVTYRLQATSAVSIYATDRKMRN